MMQQNKEQNYLSIVVVFNQSSSNFYNFFNTINEFCEQNFANYEFIFVDNSAHKNTITQIIESLTNNEAIRANLVTLPYEANKEQAILAGIDAAIGDYVFEFEDTTIDYLIDDLWSMYRNCLAGNDIVLLKPNYKIGFMEQVFYKLLAKYSNKNSAIYNSRIHLVSRRAINRVNNINRVIYYRKYAYCNSGLDYIFVDYRSSKSIKRRRLDLQQLDFATDLLIIFTSLGKRAAMILSLLFAALSIFALMYTMTAYITTNVIHGWTTTMLFLSVSFSGVFLCFAIIIKYLSLLLMNQQENKTLTASMKRI